MYGAFESKKDYEENLNSWFEKASTVNKKNEKAFASDLIDAIDDVLITYGMKGCRFTRKQIEAILEERISDPDEWELADLMDYDV